MSFLPTATVYFNSKAGSCIKCTVDGLHDRKHKHTSFAKFDCPLRTDEDFRAMRDEDHHQFIDKKAGLRAPITPLVQLPIHMIDSFTVADDLHLIYIGTIFNAIFQKF